MEMTEVFKNLTIVLPEREREREGGGGPGRARDESCMMGTCFHLLYIPCQECRVNNFHHSSYKLEV